MTKLAKALQSAAGNAGAAGAYIEDVFSTYLYTGNGSTQTITNGIDLAGEGGLVWTKKRNSSTQGDNMIVDTANGLLKTLITNSTAAAANYGGVDSFNSSGYTLTSDPYFNGSGSTYVGWTFRKAPKFFDVVTYTGTGTTLNVPHNLGSVPGCIIIKRTDTTSDWKVYHRSLGNTYQLFLNTTAAQDSTSIWDSTTPTDSVFTLGGSYAATNASGGTYVAYLFAHDAGGFGDSGEENVISCGSYTGNGTTQSIDLGWEPQWVMVKQSNAVRDWVILDNMRPFTTVTYNKWLLPHTSGAEATANSTSSQIEPSATGFNLTNSGSETNTSGGEYIYIAIRRGPMKTFEDATKVYQTIVRNGTSIAETVPTNIIADFMFEQRRNGGTPYTLDRLRGRGSYLNTSGTDTEGTQATGLTEWGSYYIKIGDGATVNSQSYTYVYHMLRRAPGFFDEVCYTGTSSSDRQISHNLGVTPEMIIVKARNDAGNWYVYHADLGDGWLTLNTTDAVKEPPTYADLWGVHTSTYFDIDFDLINGNDTYVAYLFASCQGVSKVGSYTGTGTTLQVDCGFSAGARFVLIKRTDSTGDWYIWDSTRGIISGNDPYIRLNSTAAEVTSTDYIDPLASGFEISSTAPAAINASGGSFIYLAIA